MPDNWALHLLIFGISKAKEIKAKKSTKRKTPEKYCSAKDEQNYNNFHCFLLLICVFFETFFIAIKD